MAQSITMTPVPINSIINTSDHFKRQQFHHRNNMQRNWGDTPSRGGRGTARGVTDFKLSSSRPSSAVSTSDRHYKVPKDKDPLPVNYRHDLKDREFYRNRDKVEKEVMQFTSGPPSLPSTSTMNANFNNRHNVLRNESVHFFANLRTMYSNQMFDRVANSAPSDPAVAFFHTENMRKETEARRKPRNLPTYSLTNWNSYQQSYSFRMENPLGPQWDSEAAYTAEMFRKRLRNWESTKLGNILGPKDNSGVTGDGVRFTVMNYNVLSQKLLDQHMYLYKDCDPQALRWENRLQAFFAEIDLYRPDVICLQEIDASLLSVYDKFFEKEGYRGVFKKRTRDKEEGCAIYFRESKFRLLDSLKVDCFQPHVPILDRDNVAVFVKLQAKRGTRHNKIVVGTTHLLFNPKRLDIKLAQTHILLAELDRFSFCGFDENFHPVYYPTIMTGDFNTEPYSAISKLLTEGSLRHLDENRQPILTLRRRGADDFIPPSLGINDQCQHYRLVHARIKCQKIKKMNKFEMETEASRTLVNIVSSENQDYNEGSALITPLPLPEVPGAAQSQTSVHDENIQTPSPDDMEIESVPSDNSIAGVNEPKKQLKPRNPPKGMFSEINSPEVHPHIIEDILKTGTLCTFGSGEFTHKFHFRDAYSPKLDRRSPDDSIATTKQNGWVCVDYIYYSTVWNQRFGKPIEGKLKLLRRLGLLSRSQCKEVGSIPQRDIPSDHYPLLAEFILKN